jgi:hypothetical protein
VLCNGGYVGGGDKRRGEEIPSLMVGMKVTLPEPDRIKSCLVGAYDLVHKVVMA